LEDHGEDNGLDSIEETDCFGSRAEAVIGPGDGRDDDHSREDEAHPGDDKARPAGPMPADVDGLLGRVRPGDEIRRPEQVEELLPRQPMPAADHLVFYQSDDYWCFRILQIS
jgi:hypothetical protein